MTATLIYAHRGANREAAENTRSAFECALAYPIDGVETDVQMSRDGIAVLWHDDYLGKLGMPGARIEDLSYDELRQMDFTLFFGRGNKPEGILSLRDFVTDFHSRCRFLLEIKSLNNEDPARQHARIEQTLALAKEAGQGRVLVSSFHLPSLIHAHQLAADFPLVYNGKSHLKVSEAERLLDAHPWLHGLCLHKNTLDPAMVEKLRARGKAIAVYTCNSDEEIRAALELGVDILITDLPARALQMRDART